MSGPVIILQHPIVGAPGPRGGQSDKLRPLSPGAGGLGGARAPGVLGGEHGVRHVQDLARLRRERVVEVVKGHGGVRGRGVGVLPAL